MKRSFLLPSVFVVATVGTAFLIRGGLAPAAVVAQPLTQDQRTDIAAVFAEFDAPDTPGASVAVIQAGEVLYSEGFGSAQLEYGIPIDSTTIFHVASVSKQFTAMAVLLLAEEGRLDLDADLRDYLDWLPDLGATITPRHLLSHTSGVRDQWELLYTAGWRLDDVITKADIRRLMVRQRELNFEPGSRYLYSNMGYSVAAELVEAVSGMPFAEFTEERIFGPLGMERTHVHDDHEMVVPGRSYSYSPGEDGFRNAVLSYANQGATSLFTTAEDLVRWLDNFRTEQVGGSMLGEMTRRTRLEDGERISYALGVMVDRYRGQPRVQHGGADAGFRSQVAWFPDAQVGIAVLSNMGSANASALVDRVADIVMEDRLGPRPEVAGDGEEVEEGEEVELPAAILERYVGTFTSPQANFAFESRNGALWVTAPNESRLFATSETEFETREGGVVTTFEFQVDGEVSNAFRLEQGPLHLQAERIETEAPPPAEAFVGTYYSPEIETLYEIRPGEDGGLVLSNLRRGELELRYRSGDTYLGSEFFVRELTFTRAGGAVDGFTLTGSRVLNHRFRKLEEGVLPGRR